MNKDEILAVAIRTREDFEQKSLKVQYVQDLVIKHLSYIAESYEAELTAWIEQTLSLFPVNGCEVATAVLLDRLRTGKIVYGRYEHEPLGPHNIRKSHTFWTQSESNSSNPLIADITADQYGGPPIYVGTLIKPWNIPDWTSLR